MYLIVNSSAIVDRSGLPTTGDLIASAVGIVIVLIATFRALALLAAIPDFGMPMVGAFFPKDFSKNALAEAEGNLGNFIKDHIPDGIEVSAHVKHGTIYKEILTSADAVGADMIVMASHRPEMQYYLLGPNAARVVRHVRQSVCVIR